MEYKHIICVFPENIITRFAVSVNDVSKEFAEKLRIGKGNLLYQNSSTFNMLCLYNAYHNKLSNSFAIVLVCDALRPIVFLFRLLGFIIIT